MNETGCSFCENQDVIIKSGYNYCKTCAVIPEQAVIEEWAQHAYPSLTLNAVRALLTDMFGTKAYSFTAFRNLHASYPRGDWNAENGYEISQRDYLVECMKLHMITKDKHV